MHESIQILSGIASLLCAAVLSAAVLSPRVQEGLIVKMGLIMMIIGLLASGVIALKGFDSIYGQWNAALLIRSGLLLALLGYAWRMYFRHKGKA